MLEKQTQNQVTDGTWVGGLVLAAGEITQQNGLVHWRHLLFHRAEGPGLVNSTVNDLMVLNH